MVRRIFESRFARRLLFGIVALPVVIAIAVFAFAASVFHEQHVRSLLHTRETVLRQDLFVMREAIDQYELDNHAAPRDMDELRRSGYMHDIPSDPFTNSCDWRTEACETMLNSGHTASGICNVHSK